MNLGNCLPQVNHWPSGMSGSTRLASCVAFHYLVERRTLKSTNSLKTFRDSNFGALGLWGNAVKHFVAEVAKTFGSLQGMAKSLRDFRYEKLKILLKEKLIGGGGGGC